MTVTGEAVPSLPLVPSDEERLMRETVFGIAAQYGPAYYRKVCATGSPATELWRDLGERGYLGVHLPAEHGGGGLGITELAAVFEETAAAGCPMLLVLLSPGMIGSILASHGTEAQRERWLPGLAAGTVTSAFALTEADAGSNTQNIKTSARRDGDTYVINGQKTYISSADECDLMMVATKTGTDAKGRAQLSLFLIDADSPGITTQPIETAVQQPEIQFTVFFDDVKVPVDRLIGGEGKGLRVAFDGLNPERIMTGALSVGIARFALDRAVAYAKERTVWSAPIGTHQAIAHPLAEAKIKLEQARHMVQRAAMLHDAGLPAGEASNIAKLAAAEAGVFAVDRAIQTHGGNGVAVEYDLTTYWFLARLMLIAPVSRESVLNHVAEHSLGLPRSF